MKKTTITQTHFHSQLIRTQSLSDSTALNFRNSSFHFHLRFGFRQDSSAFSWAGTCCRGYESVSATIKPQYFLWNFVNYFRPKYFYFRFFKQSLGFVMGIFPFWGIQKWKVKKTCRFPWVRLLRTKRIS